MKRNAIAAALAASLCTAALGLGAHAQTARTPEALAEIYGTLPAKSQFDLSPDGRRVAYRIVHGGAYALRVDTLDGSAKPIVWKPTEDASLGRFAWTGDGNLLVMSEKVNAQASVSVDPKSGRRKRYYDFFMEQRPRVLAPDGRTVSTLTFRKLGDIAVFQPLAEPELVSGELPAFIATANARLYGSEFGPALVDLDKGRTDFTDRPVKGSGLYRYIADDEGRVVFATRRKFGKEDRALYRRLDGDWERLADDVLDGFTIRAVLGLESLLVMDRGTGALHAYDVASAELSESWHDGPETVSFLPRPRGGIAALWLRGAETQLSWLDEAEKAKHEAARALVEGPDVWPADSDLSGTVRLLTKYDVTGADETWLVDLDAGAARRLGVTRPALADLPAPTIETIAYQARDGLTLDGLLTVPAGAVAADVPLVVMPHGGPAGRSTAAYDPWRAYFAALGYAVFEPNFRGSTGYGPAFAQAGYGEWGAAMQTDIVDGVAALQERGLAHPDKLAIVGASYGGYAALMGTLDETPYSCAVSINGVSDLPGMLSTEQVNGGFEYWAAHIGRDTLSEEELIRRSPARRAAEIDMPVLLIHGMLDITVRKGQSAAFAEAMEKAGKPVEAVYLDKSDHYLEVEPERVRAFGETGRFLRGCLSD